MKKVYVAGPYSSDNVIDVLKNIGRGQKACAVLFRNGFAPWCPWHDKTYVMDMPDFDYTVEQFYEFSIEWLKVCDYMVVLPGYKNSKGTLAEIEVAKENNIPVYYDLYKFVTEHKDL